MNLIFDIGGVIVYPRLGEWNIPFRASEILGFRAEDMKSDRYRAAYEKAVVFLDESQYVENTDEEYTLRRKFVTSVNADMEWHMTDAEISAMAEDFTYNIERYGFFEDVKPWLYRWSRKYTLGVLSDALPSILTYLDQYGISKYFKARVISAHIGATKPDSRIYRAVLDAMEADPSDCVFVDDRICNLEAAQKIGIRAVQMARAEFMPDKLWDGPVVHNFDELDRMLESGELL